MAIAGPNGAGKTTFYLSTFASTGLRLVNADLLSRELSLGIYEAASLAQEVRRQLFTRRESFAFETVFSDPVGEKLRFLQQAVASGYHVSFCFIGLRDAQLSAERVALRVLQGGHDVPEQKLVERFPRTLANLRAAVDTLPCRFSITVT